MFSDTSAWKSNLKSNEGLNFSTRLSKLIPMNEESYSDRTIELLCVDRDYFDDVGRICNCYYLWLF